VDVREFADRFELLVDLPGVDPKGVEITLDSGVLALAGERRDEKARGARVKMKFSRSEWNAGWGGSIDALSSPIPLTLRM